MHTFTFRVEEKSHHLDGQTIISLTELHTRIGAKFHPDPLHRMASIQLSTFGLDLNQYQLGQTVEIKMSIVTKIDEPVSAPVFSPPVSEIAPSTLTSSVLTKDAPGDDSNRVPTADDWPLSIKSNVWEKLCMNAPVSLQEDFMGPG